MVQVRAGAVESNIKALILDGPLRVVAKQVTECLAAQRQQESENAYNLDAVQPQKLDESSVVDDTNGIPEEIVLKLKVGSHFSFIHEQLSLLEKQIAAKC